MPLTSKRSQRERKVGGTGRFHLGLPVRGFKRAAFSERLASRFARPARRFHSVHAASFARSA